MGFRSRVEVGCEKYWGKGGERNDVGKK